MTNISKDFEAFAATKDMPLTKLRDDLGETIYKNWVVQHAFESYQAGRAHDIDGLIAEIRMAYSNAGENDEIVECAKIEEIIRKHLGKE